MRQLAVIPILALGLIASSAVAQAHESTSSSAQSGSASCAGAVSWQNASRLIGRTATVRGRVAGTKYASSSTGSPTFLNIGVDYPSSRRFTVVIWGRNRAGFGAPERTYRARTICVRGYVGSYRGLPQMQARSPSQILIVK